MKKPRDSHLGFRMDKETHDKLFYIAEYEGRTGQRADSVPDPPLYHGVRAGPRQNQSEEDLRD